MQGFMVMQTQIIPKPNQNRGGDVFQKPPCSPKFEGKLSKSPLVLEDLDGKIKLFKQIPRAMDIDS